MTRHQVTGLLSALRTGRHRLLYLHILGVLCRIFLFRELVIGFKILDTGSVTAGGFMIDIATSYDCRNEKMLALTFLNVADRRAGCVWAGTDVCTRVTEKTTIHVDIFSLCSHSFLWSRAGRHQLNLIYY